LFCSDRTLELGNILSYAISSCLRCGIVVKTLGSVCLLVEEIKPDRKSNVFVQLSVNRAIAKLATCINFTLKGLEVGC
jgi:hypothetical protein